MTTQEDVAYFLNNPENAQKLNSLVEDIRHALMDYQVCTFQRSTPVIPNVCLRLHYNKTFTTRAVSRL